MSLFNLGATAAIRKTAPPAAPERLGVIEAPVDGSPAGAGETKQPEQSPLSALVMFVPAETIAIFVTVATALLVAFPDSPITASRVWYVFCIVLTPLFTWIGFATQWRKDHGGDYPTTAVAPWFRIIASMIAFAAWGLAVAPKVGSAILCPHSFDTAAAAAAGATTAAGAAVAAATTAAIPACNAESLSGIIVIIVGVILAALDGLIDYSPKKP
ncbi:MAG TPA: hypothetical protein VGC72_18860 [Candidatus Elarobacter sp.]|jgi:hypothetical protein